MVVGKLKTMLPLGKRGFIAVILIGALVGAGVLSGVLGAPRVAGVDNEFGNVTDERTEIRTALVVENPNPFGVRIGNTSVDYTVEMNDVAMASGNRSNLALGRGNTTLDFSTGMQNRKIPKWWTTHIRNDERTTLRIQSKVHSSLVGRSVNVPYSRTIETDIISQFNSTETRPVNASVPLVSDPVLYVNETSASWGSMTRERTPIRMQMRVYNPKSLTYTISEIGYEMTMNGIEVGSGETDRPYTIPAKSEKNIGMRTVIRNKKLDEWWVSHLNNDQKTDLKITFYANIELPSGDTVRVPLRQLTYEKRIETQIFENDSAEGALESANDTAAPETTPESGTDETTTSDGTSSSETTNDDTTPGGTTAGGTTSETTGDGTTTTDDGGLLGSMLDVDGFDRY
ncbi:LEA type 2 family protein [Haladaptatus caseinilyticus]|uniref:LEA type 2 family protein n=1 Tax=Haladaptatus caseinilyticus TaxID=2993314 RepID=UPI00224AEDEA|nr:LEA type 2 family protein [Haladaptatus caseinilyticus]